MARGMPKDGKQTAPRRTSRRTRAEKMEHKREAILAAALDLFSERGFHGTAVPLVAQKARVGTGTIYRYFEDKEALVNALYLEWRHEFGKALFADFDTAPPVREQFRELWRRLTKFARQHPKALVFLELHHHSPYLDAESRAAEERLLDVVAGALAEAGKRGVTKNVNAAMLVSLVLGAFVRVIRDGSVGRFPLDEGLLAAAENACWDAIRA